MSVCLFCQLLSLILREPCKVKFKVTTPHRLPFGVHLVQKKSIGKKGRKKESVAPYVTFFNSLNGLFRYVTFFFSFFFSHLTFNDH